VAQAAARLRDWHADGRRTLVLTGDLETMAALHAADPVTVPRINLGGIHHKAGRRERLPYLYLTDEEMGRLEALESSGAAISAQDLPTTQPVSLKALG
jgi:mannose/fructose/N-acetylgalactosamine-specific phosphotransferase system component IIB